MLDRINVPREIAYVIDDIGLRGWRDDRVSNITTIQISIERSPQITRRVQ